MYFALFTLLLIIADQVTKYFTVSMLKPVGSVEIIKNILSFTYVENRGAATAMWSSVHTIVSFVFLVYRINAVMTPITPPWLASPSYPRNTQPLTVFLIGNTISIGWER